MHCRWPWFGVWDTGSERQGICRAGQCLMEYAAGFIMKLAKFDEVQAMYVTTRAFLSFSNASRSWNLTPICLTAVTASLLIILLRKPGYSKFM